MGGTMRDRLHVFLIFIFLLTLAFQSTSIAQHVHHDKKPDIITGTIKGLEVNNILTDELELVDGTEVEVSGSYFSSSGFH